ncbi:hypothetical protein [Azospirillum doebereinerae]|uniref:PPM-type phosphatase domain-containing protein n=1 Tax=Azospirillum doebereinerae TaxID=92933 RepID=A0A3S0WS37_9PROT|nr:hypothetical protein [Azospirillum doebereinerae]RUQ66100.1 hypothetical protein EJ913_23950 [Azospirillum doebereinerae]
MLPDHCHRRIAIAAPADTGAARELAATLGEGVLTEDGSGRLDAVVAALSAHLLEQPGAGTLLLRRWGRRQGVECLAYSDHDIAPDALTGLRAQADRLATHVTPGVGTVTLARVLRPGCSDEPSPTDTALAGVAMLARPEAASCADGWFIRCNGDGSGIALVVDGAAGDASSTDTARRTEAVVAATAPGLSPQMVIGAVRRDAATAPSNETAAGVTAAVLRFDGTAVDYTALGTVAGAVVRRHGVTSLAARWAMVGYNPQMPASVHLLWKPGDHVVLHSDGCARLPVLFIERGLHEVDPTLAAAVLLRDGGLADDDRTVVVLRNVAAVVEEPASD